MPPEAFAELIAAFNRGSLDIPDGLLTAHTTYSLNGQPYETLLGRSPEDPLIRLLARGAAGYRTGAKALQYALQNPCIAMDSMTETPQGVSVTMKIDGRLRPDNDPFCGRFSVRITMEQGHLASMAVICAPDDLERVRMARG